MEQEFNIIGFSDLFTDGTQLNEKPFSTLSAAIVLGFNNNIEYADRLWKRIDIVNKDGTCFVSYLKEGF